MLPQLDHLGLGLFGVLAGGKALEVGLEVTKGAAGQRLLVFDVRDLLAVTESLHVPGILDQIAAGIVGAEDFEFHRGHGIVLVLESGHPDLVLGVVDPLVGGIAANEELEILDGVVVTLVLDLCDPPLVAAHGQITRGTATTGEDRDDQQDRQPP